MKNLVKAEWFKLRKSLAFKILLLGNTILTVFIAIIYIFVLDITLTGYKLMGNSVSLVLYHAYMGYLLAAAFISKEFSNRTFAMSLLCGHSRRQVFMSKTIGFLMGLITLFCQCVGLLTIFFSMRNGFGMDWNPDAVKMVLARLCYGLMGCLTIGAVVVLVAIIAQKAIITIGAGIGLTYALLWLETTFRDNPLPFVKYTYSYQIRQIYFGGEEFSPVLFWGVMVITFIFALVTATCIFERTELK